MGFYYAKNLAHLIMVDNNFYAIILNNELWHVCANMVLFTDMGCFFLLVEHVEQILCLIRYFWDWQNYRYWKSSNCATLFLFIQDWCSILASPKWTEKFPIIGTSKCSVSFAIDMLSKSHDHSTFFPSLLGVFVDKFTFLSL